MTGRNHKPLRLYGTKGCSWQREMKPQKLHPNKAALASPSHWSLYSLGTRHLSGKTILEVPTLAGIGWIRNEPSLLCPTWISDPQNHENNNYWHYKRLSNR